MHLRRSLPLYIEVLLRNRGTAIRESVTSSFVAVAAALVDMTQQQTCTYLIDGVTWALASFTTFVGIAGLVMIMLCSFPCPVAVVEFTIDGTIAVVIQCMNRLMH